MDRLERDYVAATEVFFDLGYQVTLSGDPKLSGKLILEDYAHLRTGDPMVAEGRLFSSRPSL